MTTTGAEPVRVRMTEAVRPSLRDLAERIPLGFECRQCGGSAYNWLMKCARYVETGKTCCPDMHSWLKKAALAQEIQDGR